LTKKCSTAAGTVWFFRIRHAVIKATIAFAKCRCFTFMQSIFKVETGTTLIIYRHNTYLILCGDTV